MSVLCRTQPTALCVLYIQDVSGGESTLVFWLLAVVSTHILQRLKIQFVSLVAKCIVTVQFVSLVAKCIVTVQFVSLVAKCIVTDL